jgi:hypothetical protein
MEPMTGIEPAYSAWEADVLPLNYIGALGKVRREQASISGPAGRLLPKHSGAALVQIRKVIRVRESNIAINVESFLPRPK